MGIAAAIGAVASVAAATAVQAGTGTGAFASSSAGATGGGGGASGPSPFAYNQPYATGVHLTNTTMGRSEEDTSNNDRPLSPDKADKAQAVNPRSTPTQSQGSQYASKDFQGVWADRLSRYLDYNTRALG